MTITDEILKSALLGTDKYIAAPIPDLAEIADKIKTTQSDKEDGFLRYAATAILFETCGREPMKLEANVSACPVGTLALFPSNAADWLKTAVASEDAVLLPYLIFQCNRRNERLPNQIVPLLMNQALKKPAQAASIVQACGESGKWLISLDTQWAPLMDAKIAESNWETGTHNDRMQFLRELRAKDPSAAIPLLTEAFPQENANNRVEFLELLENGLSDADVTFLEMQSTDKSKKVKELALDLLKLIPGSSINRMYEDHISRALSVKEQRVMLFAKKKVLHLDKNVEPSEALFGTGISKVSSIKGVEDHHHWLHKVLAFVHPDALLRHLQLSLDEFLDIVQKDEVAWAYHNGLHEAALHFKHVAVAKALMTRGIKQDYATLSLIPVAERGPFYSKVLENNLVQVLEDLFDDQYGLITRDLGLLLMQALAANPYQINQPMYRRLALHLPNSLNALLKEYALAGADVASPLRYFSAQVQEMIRLLEIRESLKL